MPIAIPFLAEMSCVKWANTDILAAWPKQFYSFSVNAQLA